MDQNNTDILMMANVVLLFFPKNRAAKNDPTGIEIRIGENKAIPKSP